MTAPGQPIALPPGLAERPYDTDLGLPIPFVNEFEGGRHDFTTLNRRRSIQCALSRLCGMCGLSLEYDIAFLGGPTAAEQRSFVHPPMHVACAEIALQLCPHLARHSAPLDELAAARRRLRKGGAGLDPASDRPSFWVLYIAHSFEIERATAEGGGLVLIFHPAEATAQRQFRYEEHGMVEVLDTPNGT